MAPNDFGAFLILSHYLKLAALCEFLAIVHGHGKLDKIDSAGQIRDTQLPPM
jgi:hypothetical protein